MNYQTSTLFGLPLDTYGLDEASVSDIIDVYNKDLIQIYKIESTKERDRILHGVVEDIEYDLYELSLNEHFDPFVILEAEEQIKPQYNIDIKFPMKKTKTKELLMTTRENRSEDRKLVSEYLKKEEDTKNPDESILSKKFEASKLLAIPFHFLYKVSKNFNDSIALAITFLIIIFPPIALGFISNGFNIVNVLIYFAIIGTLPIASLLYITGYEKITKKKDNE